jgi:hypothetical protein
MHAVQSSMPTSVAVMPLMLETSMLNNLVMVYPALWVVVDVEDLRGVLNNVMKVGRQIMRIKAISLMKYEFS